MSSVFKQRITRYVDPNGRRVKKSTVGSRRIQEKSRKWYGEYIDENGKTCRVALSTDKASSRAKLAAIIRTVERREAGLFDPYEEHVKRSLANHICDYGRFLRAKDNTDKHVKQTIGRIERLCEGCGFKSIQDLEGTKVACWLSEQRLTVRRFSAQTSNFYLDSVKYFCNWLVRHDRMPKNPVATLDRVCVETDRRHDRRSLTDEEFVRLIAAAESGTTIEGLCGTDRAMLYVLATWTGFRRRELSSIVGRSVQIENGNGSITVAAGYSKRRRQDTIPLHPWVVARLGEWLRSKNTLGPDEPLFSLKTPKGHYRKTSKMMKKDLEAARASWFEESMDEHELRIREASDFLTYQNSNGDFADFHSNRHTFITLLGRQGVPLTIAQKLARHSDPRLTANRYTHLELREKEEAIHGLATPVMPAPASVSDRDAETLVTGLVTGTSVFCCPGMAADGILTDASQPESGEHNPLLEQGLGIECHMLSPESRVHPRGFEPLTFGSVGQPTTQKWIASRRL